MDVMGIVIATVIVGGTGVLIGFLLGFAGEKLKVEVDPREEAVLAALPGNNCGGCGYPGCSGLAAAIVKGEAPVTACPVGGKACADNVAAIMGVTAGKMERERAFVRCVGTPEKAKAKFEYSGERDCALMDVLPSGSPKACSYGCIGFGNCVKACMFDAMHLVDGIAKVDKEKCTACGMCVKACPIKIIEMTKYEAEELVACSSKDPGKVVNTVCSVGCIACKICEKVCPMTPIKAVTVVDNIAHVDQALCTKCRACAEKCPKKVIIAG